MINAYYLIIIGLVNALMIIYTGENKDMDYQLVAIIAALITVAGALAINYFQSRKEFSKIGSVKSDTEDMRPKIDQIREVTKETNDYLTRDMKYSIEEILSSTKEIKGGEMKANISLTADEIKYKKRLEQEYGNVFSKEHIIANVDKLFEDNARANLENRKLKEKIHDLERALINEKKRSSHLQKENVSLHNKLRELEVEPESGDFEIDS